MHLVAVFLRRERIEHHAAIGQLKDHVLLRRYGRPFHLEEVQRERERERQGINGASECEEEWRWGRWQSINLEMREGSAN